MKYAILLIGILAICFSFQTEKEQLNDICYTNSSGNTESFSPYAYNSNVVLKFNNEVTVQVFHKQFPIIKSKIESGYEKVSKEKIKLCEIDPFTIITQKNGKRHLNDFSATIEVYAQSGNLILAFPELVDVNDASKTKAAFDIMIEGDCVSKFIEMLDYK